ncbi:MAG TPA: nucleotide pyrophosphohydrolase, partial [Ignavibacteria bacterium]|nr:nucleotide pyrophosphohydrolase [Ignavibacteria bacterium]
FCEDRDWDQYHNAKNLAIGIITEASELLENFRFKSEDECHTLFEKDEHREEIVKEMADVLYFLLRLAQKYNIDLSDAFARKMVENEKRYPVEMAKGSNRKYTEWERRYRGVVNFIKRLFFLGLWVS